MVDRAATPAKIHVVNYWMYGVRTGGTPATDSVVDPARHSSGFMYYRRLADGRTPTALAGLG